MEFTTFLIASVILLVFYLWYRRPDPSLPPFPKTPLPVVGNLLTLKTDPRPQFEAWRKECGDVFSLSMGGTLMVVVNGYTALKEALVKNAEDFSDRPPIFIDKASGIPCKGVSFNSGAVWKEQRSVTLSILREFGMGKNILADKIQEEVSSYLDVLGNSNGKPIDIKVLTRVSVSNIICSIILGQRYDYDDETFKSLVRALDFMVQYGNNVVNFFPSLHHLPGDIFRSKEVEANTHQLMDLFKKTIVEKKAEISKGKREVDSFITAYSIEREKKIKAGQSTTMDDEHLAKILLDLFEAGTETTSTTILWCIIYLLNHPDIQEDVYKEIEEEIGTERNPTMTDKVKLIKLNAVIMETQRLASLLPFGVSHTNPKDVILNGYKIPKGTDILPNLDSVLHEESIWGKDVMDFRPSRFIEGNGKVKNMSEFVPFSLGRRACLGEALAKMELFLFLSFMIQRFKFLPAKPGSLPSMDQVYKFTSAPNDFEVKIVERHRA